MTKEEFTTLLYSLSDAWAKRDYVAAISAFADDVRYADPLRYSMSNKAELQKFFQDDEGYTQSTVWHMILFDEQQQVGAAEYTYDGTYRYHGTVLVKIHEDKISRWREYQHIDGREWDEFISGTSFRINV